MPIQNQSAGEGPYKTMTWKKEEIIASRKVEYGSNPVVKSVKAGNKVDKILLFTLLPVSVPDCFLYFY